MNETNERSVASAGSVGEPVAYQAVDEYGRPYGYAQIVLPFGKWPKSQRVPLYAQPQPTLTDEERESVEAGLGEIEGVYPETAATLRELLDRMSPLAT